MNDEPQGAVTDRAGADAPGPDSGASEPRTTESDSASASAGATPDGSSPGGSAASDDSSGSGPSGSGSGTTGTGAARRRRRGSRGRGRGGSGRPAASADGQDGAEESGSDDGSGSDDRPGDASRSDDGTGDEGGQPAPTRAPRPRTRSRGGSGRSTASRQAASASAADGEAAGDAGSAGENIGMTATDGAKPQETATTEGAQAGADAGSPDGSDGQAEGTTGAKRRRRRGSRGRGRSRSGGPRPESSDDGTDDVGEAGPEDGSPATEVAAATQRQRPPRSRANAGARASTGDKDQDTAPANGKAEAEGEASPDAPTPGEAASGEEAEAPLSASAKRRRRRRRSGSKPAEAGEGGGDAAATADGKDGQSGQKGQNGRRTAAKAGTAKATTAKRATAKAASSKADAENGQAPKRAAASTRTRTRTRGGQKPEGDDGGPTRTRRSRATMRRREPMPVVPRGTGKLMLITEHGDRDQIAVVEDRQLVEHYITRAGAKSMVGNIYLGRVQNVLPGMEAAFIDIGKGRNAVLYAGEVSYDEDIGGRQQRIEQVIKAGQAVLVQVTKDPIGGKGPRLTQEISLPGRYVVMVPNSDTSGISRRLPDNERRRLRTIIKKVHPEQHGVIVRTAAEGATEQDFTDDLKRLAAEWEQISKRSKKAKAPALLYEEPELTVRVVRDLFNDEEFKEIVTDSEPVFVTTREYLKNVAPELVEKVRMHDGRLPLFEQYHLIEQIHKALERKVWLPSGGYLVIDKTEAMTVIDVNTGKHVGKANLEETVTKTNLEAAEEVARQLRLRDIGGMILIDFIDMLLDKNRREVVDTLKNAMARDKTRSQVFDISPLGILEVTRKRVSGGLLDSFSETCPTCGGRGILITHEI